MFCEKCNQQSAMVRVRHNGKALCVGCLYDAEMGPGLKSVPEPAAIELQTERLFPLPHREPSFNRRHAYRQSPKGWAA